MNLKPEEISSVIREQMKKYDVQLEVKEAGTIIQVADGIARIYGLSGAMQGELLAFPGEVYGMVLNLEDFWWMSITVRKSCVSTPTCAALFSW